MLRRAPRATLGPYPALVRSRAASSPRTPAPQRPRSRCGRASAASPRPARSEEHTSELQSLRHLVCRLLLEKKKKNKKINKNYKKKKKKKKKKNKKKKN